MIQGYSCTKIFDMFVCLFNIPANEVMGVYRNHPVCLSVRPVKKFWKPIYSILLMVGLSYFIHAFNIKEYKHVLQFGTMTFDLLTSNFALKNVLGEEVLKRDFLKYKWWCFRNLQTNSYQQRQKGGDLTQSYDKSPYTNRNVKRASDNTNNATKKFD